MAVYKVQVDKTFSGDRWSNTYHVNGSSLVGARDAADAIVLHERAIHPTFVQFTRLLVSTITEGDRQFAALPLSVAGTRTFTTDRLPVFNTLRADLSVGGVGDTARKYYRCLCEGDSSGGAIVSDLVTLATSEINELIDEMASGGFPLCKISGDLLTDVTIFALVQERQLHRRRRKKTIGIGDL